MDTETANKLFDDLYGCLNRMKAEIEADKAKKGVSTGNVSNQRRKFSSHGLNEPKVSQSRMQTAECGEGKTVAGHTVSN